MLCEEASERMRRAYYLEKKTLRQIAREEGYSRVTIQRAISDASPRTYNLTKPCPACTGYVRRVTHDEIADAIG